MTTTSNPALAARLRQATSAEHRDAETRSFVTRMMGGELDLARYVAYVAQFARVYRALEARSARPGDPTFINDRALHRSAAICSDLEALGSPDWETSHPVMPSTAAYVDRIESVSDDLPRYIAHHYTRYLGDLSGGQAIAKRVAEHYGATENQLTFYRFDGIERPGPYKIAYRSGLDALDLGAEDEKALIEEAKLAFRLNTDVFVALGTSS